MLLPLLLRIARLCMAASIFDDCDLIWFNPFIDLLFLAGMTSPAPPNTRQVRLQLLISVFYLRSFERVAFKSGYSINKLPHCKAWINMQQKKFQQVRIIQDGSQLLLLSLCLLVLYHDLEHLWFLSLFLFGLLTHWKYVRTLSATNPLLLCCVALLRKKFLLEARDPGNNPQKILPKSPKIIPKFFPSGTKMPALGSVGGVRNRKMWSVFCRTNFTFCRKNSGIL